MRRWLFVQLSAFSSFAMKVIDTVKLDKVQNYFLEIIPLSLKTGISCFDEMRYVESQASTEENIMSVVFIDVEAIQEADGRTSSWWLTLLQLVPSSLAGNGGQVCAPGALMKELVETLPARELLSTEMGKQGGAEGRTGNKHYGVSLSHLPVPLPLAEPGQGE